MKLKFFHYENNKGMFYLPMTDKSYSIEQVRTLKDRGIEITIIYK